MTVGAAAVHSEGPPAIRLLVVDDSATVRELLVQLFAGAGIEVVGLARDGNEAVAQAAKLRPDVITMDVHMPALNGLEAIERIMAETPTPTVVVSASARTQAMGMVFEALRAGAVGVVDKPAGPSDPRHAEMVEELLRTVRLMADVKVVRHYHSSRLLPQPSPPATSAAASDAARARPLVIAVAASTGGPAAIQSLLQALGADLDVPIVIVQHISRGFAAGMASWLDATCPQPVSLARQGEKLVGGHVYLGPEDRHLMVTRQKTIALSKAPPVGGFRPSANVLFESVSECYGKHAVGVILTGMGDDGVAGLRALQRTGACTIAQDEASSVVYGMPGAAVAAGTASQVLPLSALGPELRSRLGEHRTGGFSLGETGDGLTDGIARNERVAAE